MDTIHLAVYKVLHSFYQTSKGFAKKIDLVKMKRLSSGFDPLEEDFSNIGDELIDTVIGLEEAEHNKLYSIKVVNVEYDWETGYADGWDLSLVEYKENE